jgi:hypothetical protein
LYAERCLNRLTLSRRFEHQLWISWLTDSYTSNSFHARVVLIALMMEAARTSEMLVNFYQTTRRYNPEDSHLRSHPPWEPQILQFSFRHDPVDELASSDANFAN